MAKLKPPLSGSSTGRLIRTGSPWTSRSFWLTLDDLVQEPLIRTMPDVHVVDPKDAASPEATAEVQLMFDEESAVERRVAEVLNKLFFGAPAAYRRQAATNASALFGQLIKHAPADSPEFRKYIEGQFKQSIEAVIREQFKQSIEAVIREQFKEAIHSIVADEIRKELPQFEKFARRMATVPKGPRR